MVKFGVSHHKPGVKTIVSEVKTFQTNNKPPTKGEKKSQTCISDHITEKWCTLVFGDLQESCVQLHLTPKTETLIFLPSIRFWFPKPLETKTPQLELKKRSATTNVSVKPEHDTAIDFWLLQRTNGL